MAVTIGHERFHIDLTPEERGWVSTLTFNISELTPETVANNGILAAKLTGALLERDAIPQYRKDFFNEPECHVTGHSQSRKELFKRQLLLRRLHTDEAMFAEPDFLKYLWYFLYGPALPATLIQEFAEVADRCGFVTSGDLEPLSQKARALVRRYGLSSDASCEEFLKLGLEYGMSCAYARFIRDAVKKMQLNNR